MRTPQRKRRSERAQTTRHSRRNERIGWSTSTGPLCPLRRPRIPENGSSRGGSACARPVASTQTRARHRSSTRWLRRRDEAVEDNDLGDWQPVISAITSSSSTPVTEQSSREAQPPHRHYRIEFPTPSAHRRRRIPPVRADRWTDHGSGNARYPGRWGSRYRPLPGGRSDRRQGLRHVMQRCDDRPSSREDLWTSFPAVTRGHRREQPSRRPSPPISRRDGSHRAPCRSCREGAHVQEAGSACPYCWSLTSTPPGRQASRPSSVITLERTAAGLTGELQQGWGSLLVALRAGGSTLVVPPVAGGGSGLLIPC